MADGSGHATSVTNSDSKIDLAAYWNTTEWSVCGDGGGSEANFGASTTLETRPPARSLRGWPRLAMGSRSPG